MRRFATLLGTLAAATMLAAAVPQSALAATGDLAVNGKVHHDPSGCYKSDRWPLTVDNRTNEPAFIFEDADCSGAIVRIVPPGSSAVSEFGASVFIR
ncbi:hypothetical protein ACIBCM_01160 [Streptomyces sp. NPDC051018]|uniref:hypothetical protein n=1 Tax=Streptomyces sp. NPDC051018 TaxID=3365639 RepID=UPI00379EC045